MPLAERLRPTTLDELIGQSHLTDEHGFLTTLHDNQTPPSLIFWGPPGCGKTTLARLIAKQSDAVFISLSAVTSNVQELKSSFQQARIHLGNGKRTLILVDEIHRFNKSQQDAFLPVIEDGTIILIGATTENPSFELNAALLSRAQIITLQRLSPAELDELLTRAENFLTRPLPLTPQARTTLCNMADGDGRFLLGLVESLTRLSDDVILDDTQLRQHLKQRAFTHDKSGDGHYNLLSAFHKSMRASDTDAALYWAARLLESGEDPNTVLRRMVACAAEDVGLADPQALIQALAAKDAYAFLGMPESRQAIAQAIIYICTAPKSNAAYSAIKSALGDAKRHGTLPPPKHALNAPTTLMKQQGYSDGYVYDHDTQEGFSGLSYFPDELPRQSYYRPVERGFEREIQKRLAYWEKKRR